MSLHGITWDHPRAYRPLDAFAARGGAPEVGWDRQSLAGFEAHPISDLARRYDLLVIDHPGLGAALAAGALRPLGEIVDDVTLARWQRQSVARTWDSYHLDGQQWAAPIDAATQVCVLRPDLVDQPPRSWADVVALARRVPVTLCLGGPHALLGLLGMCASAGEDPGPDLLHPRVAAEAVEILREVWTHADQQVGVGDPIRVHEAMASGADLALCPLAYGYASYAQPAPGQHALRWSDAPTFGTDRPGTVLGGTGLAVSALSGADPAEVAAWLAAFLAPDVQGELVPAHGGQPADAAAWAAGEVDAARGGYYSSTRRSLEQAHIRPRAAGWIPLQDEASALVRHAITDGGDAAAVIELINDRYRDLIASPTKVGTR